MSLKLQKYRHNQPQNPPKIPKPNPHPNPQQSHQSTPKSNTGRSNDNNNNYNYNYDQDQEQIQPIPETIEYSIPNGLYRESEHKSISEIFRHIQNTVNYDQMSLGAIWDEKLGLENHVKFLNQELNQMVKSKMTKIQQGISRKITHKATKNNSRFKYNEWNTPGLELQLTNNRKFLLLLRQQYQSLTKKLQKIEQYDHKVKYDSLIKEAKDNLTKMKMMLFDKKRKNVMNGKKITELDKRDLSKVYYDCQQDYVALAKKKEEYTRRIDKIIEDNANIVDQHSKLADKELSLKNQAYKILKSLPTQMQEQHNKVMYDTKCRKMELCLRKRERDEEDFKRKYYGLLKQYEKSIQSCKNLDQKLKRTKKQLDAIHSNLQNKEHEIHARQEQNQNSQQAVRVWRSQTKQKEKEEESEKEEEADAFMLTEINNQKSTTRVTKKNPPPSHKQIKLPPFEKERAYTEYEYKPQKKLYRMKTDYSTEQQGRQTRFDQTEKYNQHQSRPTQRIEQVQDITQNSKNSSSFKKSYQQEYEQQENSYPDDFQVQSPHRK